MNKLNSIAIRYYPGRFFFLIGFLLSVVAPLHSEEAKSDFDTLTTLLKELREIRQAKYTLQRQWQDEQEQLRLIKDLEEEKLEVLDEQKKAAVNTFSQLKNRLSDTEKQNKIVNESASHLRQWIDDSCQALLQDASKYSILIDENRKKSVDNILQEDTPTTDKLVLYLNLLLDTAVAGLKSTVERSTLKVDGNKYSADVLTLGGTLKYFVTPNNQLCGFKYGQNASDSWDKLDQKYAESLRAIIRVVNSDIPPKLVSVPVPASAITRSSE